ncbi:E3 ubiquitin-protein ligase bre1 [Mycoemilia scoparia]|uniref:E3 ubiquitin protein ligase n=1 Tax=Mycoemilia scoparia TaxID=417184 RepID=A0A9W8DUW6_9FUNG|nr:E3 ubiquitin-protein ligase bre1 [Mycoemilia scoparia]
MSSERKRQSSDASPSSQFGGNNNNSATSPPLPKKRHTSSNKLDTLPSNKQFEETLSQCIDIDNLHAFQKEAIWRQMQEYKRQASRAREYCSVLERRQDVWVENITRFCQAWDRLSGFLGLFDSSEALSKESKTTGRQFLDLFLPYGTNDFNFSDRARTPTKPDSEAQDSIKKMVNQLEVIAEKTINVVVAKQNSLGSDSTTTASSLNDLSFGKEEREQVPALKSQVERYRRRALDAEKLLEIRDEALRSTEKLLDRYRSPVTKALNGIESNDGSTLESKRVGPGNLVASPPSNSENTTAAMASSKENPSSPAQGNVQQRDTSSKDGSQKAVIDEIQEALVKCQKEVEEMVEERIKLKQEIDRLTLKLSFIPEEQIKETIYYRELESRRDFFEEAVKKQEIEIETLTNELEELRATRRSNLETIVQEESQQRLLLEQEHSKLQQDLMRVRTHRDAIQRELGELKSRMSAIDSKFTDLTQLAESRKDRVSVLLSENRRLRATIATQMGDHKAAEFYSGGKDISGNSDNSGNEPVTLVEELRKALETSNEKSRLLEEKLNRISEQSEATNAAETAAIEIQDQKTKIEKIQKQLSAYERIIGFSCVDDNGEICVKSQSGDNATTGENGHPDATNISLKDALFQLAEKQKKIESLIHERDDLNNKSQLMEGELETLCKLVDQLEASTASSVDAINSRQRQIARLIGEKSKYEEKFLSLNKERDAIKSTINTLRQQSFKQIEFLKDAENKEKHLHTELVQMDKELASLKRQVNHTMQRLEEATIKAQESEQARLSMQERYTEIESMLNERTRLAEKTQHEKKHIEEELERVQTRLTKTTTTRSSDSELKKLCEEYKSLLKCTSCQLRFKSHVLQRCMHVFCKPCIDSRIETRQRKCPTCGDAFGTGDIKQIFL